MLLTLSTLWPTVMAILFVVVSVFMVLVVLIQKPKGGGLGSAFGGGGGGGSETAAFGAKTGDVLTWITVACFVAFLLLAIGLTWATRPEDVAAQQDPAASAPLTTETAPAEEGPDAQTQRVDQTQPEADDAGDPAAEAPLVDPPAPEPLLSPDAADEIVEEQLGDDDAPADAE